MRLESIKYSENIDRRMELGVPSYFFGLLFVCSLQPLLIFCRLFFLPSGGAGAVTRHV